MQTLSQVMALNKIFFVIGWILFTYTPFTIVGLTISSSDLQDGGFVCPGVPITLNCTTVGSAGIAWRSQEYIGDLDQLLIPNFRPVFYNDTSRSVNTTVATLTRNENGILESTLRIIPTLNHLTSSVVCVHTDSGNSTLPFTINVIDVPTEPSEMISNQTKGAMEDNCILHLSWSPPANMASQHLSRYKIQIDGESVTDKIHTDSTWQLFAYPVCSCGRHTVSVQAVNTCGHTGRSAVDNIIFLTFLPFLECRIEPTPEPVTSCPPCPKCNKNALTGTIIFLSVLLLTIGTILIIATVWFCKHQSCDCNMKSASCNPTPNKTSLSDT